MDKRRLNREELEETIYNLYDGLLFVTNVDEYRNMRENISFT